jgi:hypothetical protein
MDRWLCSCQESGKWRIHDAEVGILPGLQGIAVPVVAWSVCFYWPNAAAAS